MSDPADKSKRLLYSEYGLFFAVCGVFAYSFVSDIPRMRATFPVYLTNWHLFLNAILQFAVCVKMRKDLKRDSYLKVPVKENQENKEDLLEKAASLIITRSETELSEAEQEGLQGGGRDIVFACCSGVKFDPRQFMLTSSILVAGLFWALLDNRKPLQLIPHGLMAVLFSTHSLIWRLPYHIKQAAPWVMGFGLAYSIFSLTYTYSGGYAYDPQQPDQKLDYIYPQLDWKEQPFKATAFSVGGVFLVTPLMVTLLSLLKHGLFKSDGDDVRSLLQRIWRRPA